MAVKRKRDFAEILLHQRIVSREQLAEAEQLAKNANISLQEALIRLGYASGEEICRALAEEHGLEYVNLREAVIPPHVVELVPESVARENVIMPVGEEDGELKVAVSDPNDYETFEKLRFILNRSIQPVLPLRRPFWRQSTDTTGKPTWKVRTRCCRSSPTRQWILRKPRRAFADWMR